MLALYAITESVDGSGAMAVLTARCSSVTQHRSCRDYSRVPRGRSSLRRDCLGDAGSDVISIKSFFFFLIGLMFPTDLRQIALAGVAAVFLFLFRIPAVMLATKGIGSGRRICGC